MGSTRMRITSLVLTAAVALSGCLPAQPTAQQPDTATPSGTRALPPEHTAVPSPTPLPALEATPSLAADPSDGQAQALLADFAADADLLRDRTQYHIEARVEFDPLQEVASIDGAVTIRYRNQGPENVAELPLMLWPNDEQYRGSMQVEAALIEGRRVEPEMQLGGLAAVFPLEQPLAAGEVVNLTVPFHVEAEGPIGGSTPHRFGITERVLFAPTFYPLVPRRVQGEWELRDAPPGGDTTNSEVASYTVELDVPAEYELVASGVEAERRTSGRRSRVTYVGGPIRDFAFALGPFEMDSRQVGEVQVHGWYLEQHAADADRMLDAAAFQLGLLNERVGPYPYTELDLVDVPGAYGGIEYPGLVTVGTMGTAWLIEPTVHEVAHQWFYGLIGDDQLDEPWMDEAFATYSMALYLEFSEGQGRATGYLTDLRSAVRDHPDSERPIGLGVGEYEGRDYSILVYLKGALFYQELRQRLGDEVFFDFLQSFYQMYRYQVASAQDFQASAEASCGCELDPLFDTWVFEGGPVPELE